MFYPLIDDIKNVLQEWSLGLSFGQLSTEKQVCVEGFHHLQEISNSTGVTIFSLDQEVPWCQGGNEFILPEPKIIQSFLQYGRRISQKTNKKWGGLPHKLAPFLQFKKNVHWFEEEHALLGKWVSETGPPARVKFMYGIQYLSHGWWQ